MGRGKKQNRNTTKNSGAGIVQQNVTNPSDTHNENQNKLRKLWTGKYRIGLVISVLIVLGSIVWLCIHLCGGKEDAKEVRRFKEDYILRTDSQKYNVFAGDSVSVLNGCQLLLKGDTICISDNDDILTEENFKRDSCRIIPNKNGTERLFTYSTKVDRTNKRMMSKNDSVEFKAVDGEIFEISQDKDTVNNRPLLVLGDHVLRPNYKVSEPKDTVLLKGHDAVKPSKFVLFENMLIVRFEKHDSVNSVKILKEYGDDIISEVKTFGEDVEIPITEKDSIEKRYRIFAKGHVSCLIEPTNAELIELSSSLTKKDGNWLLSIISIIAIIEFGVIVTIAIRKFLKKRKGKKEISDNGTIDSDETTEEIKMLENQIKEKEEFISKRKEELEKYNTPKEENKNLETPSTMNELEKEYGKRPESEEEKIAFVNRLIDSETYEEEEFVKQLEYERKKIEEYVFRKSVLDKFDELYCNWIKLVNNKNNAELETDDNPSLQEDGVKNLKEEIEAEEINIKNLKEKLLALKGSIKTEEDIEKLRKKLEEKEQKLKEITDRATKAEEKIKEANKRAEKAERESRKIEERIKNEFEETIKNLEKDIENEIKKSGDLTKKLSETRGELEKTTGELRTANDTIVAKNKALERFNKTITDIAPAKDYADKLEKLLKIGNDVEKTATALGQNKNIDDYLVNKYIARYRSALSSIDMQMFITDVLNVVKAQFVYKSQMLSTFDQKDKKAFHESMKLYFYDTYLKKYVDALIVLNETMVGMQYLADGATANDVKPFENYRNEINDILKSLEVEVLSVRIMESCADNLMLTVIPKSLDFECAKNSICQIDNCIVYLKGASKPNEKIQVIVKK